LRWDESIRAGEGGQLPKSGAVEEKLAENFVAEIPITEIYKADRFRQDVRFFYVGVQAV